MATSDSDIDGMSVSDFVPSWTSTDENPKRKIYDLFSEEIEDLAFQLWFGKITKQTFNRKTNESLKKWKVEAKEEVKEEEDVDDLAKGLGDAKISK